MAGRTRREPRARHTSRRKIGRALRGRSGGTRTSRRARHAAGAPRTVPTRGADAAVRLATRSSPARKAGGVAILTDAATGAKAPIAAARTPGEGFNASFAATVVVGSTALYRRLGSDTALGGRGCAPT